MTSTNSLLPPLLHLHRQAAAAVVAVDLSVWHAPFVVLAFLAGLGIGLGYAFSILQRLMHLGSHMGKSVKQAERLSVHVSGQYAPLRERVDRLERELENIKKVLTEG